MKIFETIGIITVLFIIMVALSILFTSKKVSENEHSIVYCKYKRNPVHKESRIMDVCIEYFKE